MTHIAARKPVGEIVAGSIYGSMALLADGWHMATHAGALSISAAAYAFARRKALDRRYVFGTGKVGDLAGFTSAVLLAGVACLIGYEGIGRLIEPSAIPGTQRRFCSSVPNRAMIVPLMAGETTIISSGQPPADNSSMTSANSYMPAPPPPS